MTGQDQHYRALLRSIDDAARPLLLWGIGREGQAVLDWLATRSAGRNRTLNVVTEDIDTSSDPTVRLRQAGWMANRLHPSQLATCPPTTIVVKSPGVSLYRHEIMQAQHRGLILTSATSLWLAARAEAGLSADNIAIVTGSKGKSTTTALIEHLLRHGGAHVRLGGNIGTPPLAAPINARADGNTIELLELSSYQIADLPIVTAADGFVVGLAGLVSLFPEHRDWHGSTRQYYRDKLRILPCARHAILNGSDKRIQAAARSIPGAAIEWCNQPQHGAFIQHDRIMLRGRGDVGAARCNGLSASQHLGNLCLAVTMADRLGIDPTAGLAAIDQFQPLPHRLTMLGIRDSIYYVDDSISTTPQSVFAALSALHAAGWQRRQIALIIGGQERGQQYDRLVLELLSDPPAALIAIPDTGSRIVALLRRSACGGGFPVFRAADMAEAVTVAKRQTPADGVVLLSPGAPSYGPFRDFTERGRQFARLAGFAATDYPGTVVSGMR